MYNTKSKNPKLNAYNSFRNKYGNEKFPTVDLAQQYANLKMDWWGSNLVFLGIDEEPDGTFSPKFNLFD